MTAVTQVVAQSWLLTVEMVTSGQILDVFLHIEPRTASQM